MITFRQIELSDREKIYELTKASGHRACESSFGILYIWRKAYCALIAYEDGFAVIRQHEETRESYYPPIGSGDLEALLKKLEADAKETGKPLRFICAEKAFADAAAAYFQGRASITEMRDHFDYIYRSRDLAELTGKSYHGKRNHINKFTTLFRYHTEPITSSNIGTVLELNRMWCIESGQCDNGMLEDERCAVANLMASFPETNARGMILYAEGKPAAYTAGTPLYPGGDEFIIHFEKALKAYDGAYAAINNFFAKTLADEFAYLNREEDMGVEGLRKAKLSYNPVLLLPKYEIEIHE